MEIRNGAEWEMQQAARSGTGGRQSYAGFVAFSLVHGCMRIMRRAASIQPREWAMPACQGASQARPGA